MYLSFSHRKKRRFITDDAELKTVALLCIPCHTKIEHKPHEEMYEIVTDIINKRNMNFDEWIHAEIDRERVEDDAAFFAAMYD